MSRMQRFQSVLIGLGMLLCCFVMVMSREAGYYLAAAIIVLSLVVKGIQMLVYYQTMARHMVGGKAMLFLGILVLDFGIFTLTMVDTPSLFILLYLLLFHSFSGAVSLLRALEARRFSALSWLLNLAAGIVSLAVAVGAVVCALVLHSMESLAYLYFAGFLYSACIRIISAFRRTEIIYIQ